MKKIFSLFTVAFISMFALVLGVNAEEVANATELSGCISGTDTVCKLTDNISSDVVIPSGRTVTLDLNGKELSNATTKDTIYVEKGATLTITGNGTVVVKNATNYATLFNNGTVIIENGSFKRDTAENNNKWYVILNHGIMTINDATVTIENENEIIQSAGGHPSLIDNGYSSFSSSDERKGFVSSKNIEEPTLTINGGTFIGGLNTIKNDDNGILEINDGLFKNTVQVSLLNWNEAEINGGTFETPTGNDKTNIAVKNSANSINKGILVINGGTFNAENTLEGSVVTPIEINGGTFNYTKNFINQDPTRTSDNLEEAATAPVITSGKFASDVTKYLDTNIDKVEVDGVYYVGESYKVTLDKIENGKVTVSTEEAVAGQPVKLTVEANKGYKLAKAVYVGADDKEVEIKDGIFTMPDEDVTVKVTFEKEAAAKGDVIPPKTGDNTGLFMILGVIGLMGAAVTAKKLRNN